MRIAKVIVDVPAISVNQTYDYKIPEQFIETIKPGMRVILPFGPRKIMGYVVELTNESEFTKLRSILDVLDIEPAITEELLEIGRWIADQTLCLHISALQAMLPQALKSTYKKSYRLIDRLKLADDLQDFFSQQDVRTHEAFIETGYPLSWIQQGVQKGSIEIDYEVKEKGRVKTENYLEPDIDHVSLQKEIEGLTNQAIKQKEVLSHFLNDPEPIKRATLRQELNVGDSTIRTLLEKGIVRQFSVEVMRDPYEDRVFTESITYDLTDEQEAALAPILTAVEAEENEVFLLHGVTGSGKTEVYLHAIQKVIEMGKEAIVLVPEISLTPQMVSRFKARFGDKVAVMHSALSNGEKYDEWRKIQRKEVQVVVGARSAIFAPFENLGIIIIDEEHETSYKQEDQPRYHARQVAIERAKKHNCSVILGSATPILETYARAQKGVYHLLELTKRTNTGPLPDVQVIDMRAELQAGNRSMFSRDLITGIETRLEKKEQIVLLLNRRGFATFIMCRDCGFVKECPNCDIALTYHKRDHKLRCHYCNHEDHVPVECPECTSDAIRYFGTGTQKVEEELTKLIPEARIIRMDVDTTRRKGAHERLLTKFENYEADILLGTQMIAKGLDFKKVTLAAVLTADSMLHLPDFRSSEKTFQLLTQVSGRSGRHDLVGEVLIQTYTPEHYSVQLASTYDFDSFYEKEMQLRRTFQYPPYVYLVLIQIAHENLAQTVQAAQDFASQLQRTIGDQTIILGPSPSPMARINNRYRYQILVKYKHEPRLIPALQTALESFRGDLLKGKLQIRIDMEPYQLM